MRDAWFGVVGLASLFLSLLTREMDCTCVVVFRKICGYRARIDLKMVCSGMGGWRLYKHTSVLKIGILMLALV
jgi:hypothetical protein